MSLVPFRDGAESVAACRPRAGYAPERDPHIKSPMTTSVSTHYDLRPRDFVARLPRRVRGVGARRRARHLGRRALALLAVSAVPAVAAPQDWAAFRIGNAVAADTAVIPMPFERTGESFPGSAFYYLASDHEPGGALDQGAHWDAGSPVGPAAQALRAAGDALDRERALTCLTQAIYYEAASEPDAGQRAVAQVVLNRVAHPAYPKTVCGVVYQGSEKSTGCQFTFTCDGSLARMPVRLFWLRAENVARAALGGYVFAPVGLATHYHTAAVHPYWADTMNFIGQIGAHRFYRFGGPAGAPGLFQAAVYRGGEPLPAPRPHSDAAASSAPSLDPAAIERAFARGTAIAAASAPAANVAAAPAPSYAPAVTARGGDALYRAERLPEATGIRPEYANSGKWIAQPGT